MRLIAGALAIAVAAAHRPALGRRAIFRQLVLPSSCALAGGALGATAKDLPFNPLGLKGQFWETGEMVYVKPSRDGDEIAEAGGAARESLAASAAALKDAREAADAGDAAAVLALLRERAVSELTLRRDGAAVAAAAAAAADNAAAAAASRATADAARAFLRVNAAGEARSGSLVDKLAAVPAPGREIVRVSDDPGLDLVVALEDCITAIAALLAARPGV